MIPLDFLKSPVWKCGLPTVAQLPNLHAMPTRRAFLRLAAAASASAFAQAPGERPARAGGVEVINPRGRVPVGLIIDDSTCLVNLNRFAMPQFDQAFRGENPAYHKPWREWPVEIPDAFVRKFGEWCAGQGVKGKYSDRAISRVRGAARPRGAGMGAPRHGGEHRSGAHADAAELGHPSRDGHAHTGDRHEDGASLSGHHDEFMENWDWTTGRSADEIADYMAYALGILKNVGLPCEGVTTPGGFGNRARPALAQASFESVRAVFGAEIPHYFRDLFADGATKRGASRAECERPRWGGPALRGAASSDARATGPAGGIAVNRAAWTSSSPRTGSADAWWR